jgi:glycolate oxidase iron-sulfur subunit
MIKKGRALPFAKSKSFLNSYPEYIINSPQTTTQEDEAKPTTNKGRKVAIFIGCMANYAYTSTGDALVKILEKLEIDTFIPKKQLCCGAPAYFTGDFDTVDDLTKKNIVYFEKWLDDVEAIIIPEATCSAMITHDWVTFFNNRGEDEWASRAQAIVDKTFLATDWLYKNTHLNELLAKANPTHQSITYHDPCHAKKVQGVYQEPRALLSNNYEIKEMSDSDQCCGFGGVTIQSEKYHLAEAAGKPKAEMIKKAEADYVSAECSACRLQLNDAMSNNDVTTIFKNPVELIWEALDSN